MRYWAQLGDTSLAQAIKPRVLIRSILVWIVNTILRILVNIFLIIDASELDQVPEVGPLIAVANHVNLLDAPVLITELVPRPLSGFVKKESWENPFLAFLFNVWQGIPIDRSIADFQAFREAKKALSEGKILAVAPEGTRSEDGLLTRGKPGIVLLAGKLNVPILPIAYYGHENYKANIKRLKRTPMHIRVGKPFRIKFDQHRNDKTSLQVITDAIMLEVAALLPDSYHGAYADITVDKEEYIEYLN